MNVLNFRQIEYKKKLEHASWISQQCDKKMGINPPQDYSIFAVQYS